MFTIFDKYVPNHIRLLKGRKGCKTDDKFENSFTCKRQSPCTCFIINIKNFKGSK